jgi:hypothetical protein
LITAVDYSFTDLRNSKKLAKEMGLDDIAREYRLHDKVLMPNKDVIAKVECCNIDDVFRVVIVSKS